MADHLAFIGRRGIGTSSVVANIAAALVDVGFRVAVLGFSPLADSTRLLIGAATVATVSDQVRAHSPVTLDSVVHRGFKDIFCIELGGDGTQTPDQAVAALDRLEEERILSLLHPDFVLYDLSGSLPRELLVAVAGRIALQRIVVVSTADYTSLTGVNSLYALFSAQSSLKERLPFAGLILNRIRSSFAESFVTDFAFRTHTRSLGTIPDSEIVRQCELYDKTVIEASPLSNQSYCYRRLGNQLFDEMQSTKGRFQPNPFTLQQLKVWSREWADRLYALENGLVTDGLSI